MQIEYLEDRVVPSYFPSTTNGIAIFEDQLPDNMSNAMVQFLATHIDGTQKELLGQTDQFRAINPNFTVLHYQLGTGNSPYDYIINNQWASDWSYVNQQESWFAHQTYSGEPQSTADLASGRVGNSTGWDQADISNPAWQQYTLNQVIQNMAATGSNGWFADSYTYGLGGAGYDGTIPTRYQGTNAANSVDWPGGVDWTTQLGNWAQTIENAFAQYNAANGTSYVFIPNLDARVTSWEPNWYDNANGVPFIDGAFLEGFGEWTDTYDWTLSMNRGLNLTDNNKIVIMQPYPSADPSTSAGQQQVDFFLGTYLLLKGNQTYLNIDYSGGAQYYPEYNLNLGAPTTALPSNVSSYLWDGVYRRDFQNGFVLVNPGSTTYTLNLGGNYQQVIASGGGTLSDSQIDANGNYIGGSMSYQNVNSITLTGGSAAIFLNPSSSPTVVTPAKASVNPVTGTSVGLSVLGQENGSDNGLTYTWSSSGPANVTFADNSAKSTIATFSQAGTYAFTAAISDGTHSVTSSVTVTVNQTLTSLKVSPATPTVVDGATQQLTATALDQFGNLLTKQPTFTWSIDSGGIGTIGSKGVYTAPSNKIGSATVRAHDGASTATAAVTIVASGTASFIGTDTTDQGNWQKAYGAQGSIFVDAPATFPPYATVSLSGQSRYVWTNTTQDVRALVNPAGGRVAATWYAAKSFSVNVDVTDGQTHQVALYFLDWEGDNRSEQVDVLNSAGQVIDSRVVSGFSGGKYEVWNISGNVTFRITRLSGPNVVMSGIFFGGPSK
ncbi:MAG TPA: putative glycoside hydrolase [Gemmata sp.]|nr:putative glycoside hydrolase [Gemmata sp.]